MKIKIEKPEENVWKFPCLGKSKLDEAVVYFYSEETGVVVEQSTTYPYLYISREFYMEDFNPVNSSTKPEENPFDWDKAELPIWYKDENGAIIKIVNYFDFTIFLVCIIKNIYLSITQ